MAIDLENLREGLDPVVALLRHLDDDGAVLHLVGARWAQDLLSERRLPKGWRAQRDVTGSGPEAADSVIHGLLDRWRAERRIAVVASSDGGFAESLAAHRYHGVPSFVVTTGRPARRLISAAEVLILSDAGSVVAAADCIEAARVR